MFQRKQKLALSVLGLFLVISGLFLCGNRILQNYQRTKSFNSLRISNSSCVNSFSSEHNLNLGIMWSSGKDSGYAAYLMKRHNYNITCLMTMKSKNKYSYMFHTPNIDMAEIQAKAMEVPILIEETIGEKEDELKDMKELMRKAKENYKIDGVVTGALFSHYQRERIEKAADEIGLKIFSPLWHKNQEEEMRELIDNGFEIVFSSIAADGLDKSWVGKPIGHKDIDKLTVLRDKIGRLMPSKNKLDSRKHVTKPGY